MDPIQRANLPQAIAERIIDLITRGELQLGQRLPPQRQLAKDLGVGVSSLRESLQSLTAMGLIQMRPGLGTFVSETFDGLAGRQAGLVALTSTQDLEDLLETRMVLDGVVAVMACRRASAEDLARVRSHHEEMARSAADQDMPGLERADLAFHLSVADAAHNDVLAHLIRSVITLISNQIHATPYSQATLDQHLAIVEALEARDADAALAAVRTVILASASVLGVDLEDLGANAASVGQVVRATVGDATNPGSAPSSRRSRSSRKKD